MATWKKILIGIVVALVVVFVAIQFVPYGRPITSPPVTNQFKWSTPDAEAIAVKACYDCHSNQPKVWWGIQIAPMSWLAQNDATQGRAALNFSAWTGYPAPEQFAKAVQSGQMPPFKFWIVHPDAKLTDAEKQALIQGYQASIAQNHAPTVPAQVKSVIESKCSQCHSASLALGYRAASAKQAQSLIQNMTKQGANLSSSDQQLLQNYFVTGQ